MEKIYYLCDEFIYNYRNNINHIHIVTKMKKIFLLCAAITVTFAMTSCKSKESAYKKAYDKAKAEQQSGFNNNANTPATNTVATTPVATTTTPVAPAQNTNDVPVRIENVTLVSGPALKAYSVVVASMSVPANATTLAKKLEADGYKPSVVKATVNGAEWYRVVATSFDTKADAAASRAKLEGQYQGAWLLYKK